MREQVTYSLSKLVLAVTVYNQLGLPSRGQFLARSGRHCA